MDTYDGITIGDTVSELFMNNGTFNSEAIGKGYDLKYRSDLTGSEAKYNTGATDTSIVFEVVETFGQQSDTKLEEIEENTDTLETLITTTNTKLDDVIAKLDGELDTVIKNPLDDNGKLEVAIQDQTTKTIDVRMSRDITGPYTLAEDTVAGAYTITLTDATGLNVNDKISLTQNHNAPCFYRGYIKDITNNVLTVNVPLDCVFSDDNDAEVYEIENNLGTSNGATTPVIYSVYNPSSVPIDINRLMFKMVTDGIPNFLEFGDLTLLTNGLVIRKKYADGTYHNIFNVRNNSEFALLSYDYITFLATNPAQGQNGLTVRFTFNGQDKHGVVIRLAQGESLEAVIQDDLTDLLDFKIMAEGSFTDEF